MISRLPPRRQQELFDRADALITDRRAARRCRRILEAADRLELAVMLAFRLGAAVAILAILVMAAVTVLRGWR